MVRKKKFLIPEPPVKSCGKNRYSSREEADMVARQQEILFAANDLKLKSYFCGDCGGWHLTREKPHI
jgi:hypothetical protein